MREDIGLFRGKRIGSRAWVSGNLWRYSSDGKTYILHESGTPIEVDPATVGEYTGLKDLDGKRIWEGSIVRGMFRYGLSLNAVVSFEDGAFGLMWYAKNEAGDTDEYFEGFTSIYEVGFKVIGDVVDNPELLGV